MYSLFSTALTSHSGLLKYGWYTRTRTRVWECQCWCVQLIVHESSRCSRHCPSILESMQAVHEFSIVVMHSKRCVCEFTFFSSSHMRHGVEHVIMQRASWQRAVCLREDTCRPFEFMRGSNSLCRVLGLRELWSLRYRLGPVIFVWDVLGALARFVGTRCRV